MTELARGSGLGAWYKAEEWGACFVWSLLPCDVLSIAQYSAAVISSIFSCHGHDRAESHETNGTCCTRELTQSKLTICIVKVLSFP